jgi:hypothetical protein
VRINEICSSVQQWETDSVPTESRVNCCVIRDAYRSVVISLTTMLGDDDECSLF